MVDQLSDWYRNDPSSTIHGATGWLLRNWGQREIVRAVDENAISYDREREWFTLVIETGENHSYQTYIVIPPGDYDIGSPDDVRYREGRNIAETLHRIRLTRPVAILNREITRGEFGQLRPNFRGLFDIHAKVLEWCHGWYSYYTIFDVQIDPLGSSVGEGRASRGGSWLYDAKYSRAANRASYPPASRYYGFGHGLRLAIVPFASSEAVSEPESVGGGASSEQDRWPQGPSPWH